MALVLEVLVNGERFTVAGEESLSMLSAHVIARGKLGSDSQGVHSNTMDKPVDICLSVSGMTSRGDRERDQAAPRQRSTATAAQIASTTPNGQAPCRNP